VEQAIHALPMMKDEIKVLIAGDGDILDNVKKLAQQLNLNDRITFTGYSTPDELNVFTKSSWLGLNLLNDLSLNYRYSLANKFFDYIQCDIPQITMRFPEYERINNQYEVAILIDDLKPETIAQAVNNLIASPSRYQELKLNCTKAAADLCWENEHKKLLDFYQAIP
jgi:glycosyltransferase involved in cell wall biosynthesis